MTTPCRGIHSTLRCDCPSSFPPDNVVVNANEIFFAGEANLNHAAAAAPIDFYFSAQSSLQFFFGVAREYVFLFFFLFVRLRRALRRHHLRLADVEAPLDAAIGQLLLLSRRVDG